MCRRVVAGRMDWAREAPRLARLARLGVSDEEARRLGDACAAIARAFSDLAEFAATLPDAPARETGALREDVVAPAPAEEVAAILRAAPRVDEASGAIVAERGA